jgi:hypothetical protein
MMVELAGRTVNVRALPIGIPFDRFVALAETAPQVITVKLFQPALATCLNECFFGDFNDCSRLFAKSISKYLNM